MKLMCGLFVLIALLLVACAGPQIEGTSEASGLSRAQLEESAKAEIDTTLLDWEQQGYTLSVKGRSDWKDPIWSGEIAPNERRSVWVHTPHSREWKAKAVSLCGGSLDLLVLNRWGTGVQANYEGTSSPDVGQLYSGEFMIVIINREADRTVQCVLHAAGKVGTETAFGFGGGSQNIDLMTRRAVDTAFGNGYQHPVIGLEDPMQPVFEGSVPAGEAVQFEIRVPRDQSWRLVVMSLDYDDLNIELHDEAGVCLARSMGRQSVWYSTLGSGGVFSVKVSNPQNRLAPLVRALAITRSNEYVSVALNPPLPVRERIAELAADWNGKHAASASKGRAPKLIWAGPASETVLRVDLETSGEWQIVAVWPAEGRVTMRVGRADYSQFSGDAATDRNWCAIDGVSSGPHLIQLERRAATVWVYLLKE